MAQRSPIIGGNWKMNLNRQQAVDLAGSIARCGDRPDDVEVVLFPPFPYLDAVASVLRQTPPSGPTPAVRLGAQDFYDQPDGAFTGEVSLAMLEDLAVDVVLVGHSERRHVIGEDDQLINRKLRAALDRGLSAIVCVGETLEQRQLGQTDAVNIAQTRYALAGVDSDQMARVTIAYEPVWAIGTGKTATASDAQRAHEAIRGALASAYGERVANAVRIQYGGSVKPANAAELFAQRDIDGGLIGGASLKADDFTAIVQAASVGTEAACGG